MVWDDVLWYPEIVKGEDWLNDIISAEPKAEADNTYWDLDYSWYLQKTKSNNIVLFIVCFKENYSKQTIP